MKKINYFTSLSSTSDEIVVYLGRYNQSGPNPDEVSRRINETKCHPYYDPFVTDNDICLLKLSTPVTFTDFIRPISLASENSTFHTGTISWVSGWGNTQTAGKLTYFTIKDKHCRVLLLSHDFLIINTYMIT